MALVSREQFSVERLNGLAAKLQPVEHLLEDEPLCIYATGSYGRLEAWDGSDVDLFFLYEPEAPDNQLPLLTFIRLAACLIEATEEMGFLRSLEMAGTWRSTTSIGWRRSSGARTTTA